MSAIPRTSDRGTPAVPRERIDRVLDLVRQGWTLREVAAQIGYSEGEVISRWRKTIPGFAAELDEAKAAGKVSRRRTGAAERVLSRIRSGETQRAAAAAEGVTCGAIAGWCRRVPGYRAALTAAAAAGKRVRYTVPDARRKADVLTWIGRGQAA